MSRGHVGSWARVFGGTPGQVRAARHWVDSLLDGCPAAADAALLVSEVATNAIRHTSSGSTCGTLQVSVLLADHEVRIAVTDEGTSLVPRLSVADADHEGGRGLCLVDAMSDDWGTAGDETGRVVWFRLGWAEDDSA